ncbi:MAG: alpha/beta hydrolase [Myxococcales bacterium]
MNLSLWIWLGAGAGLSALLLWTLAAYLRDIRAAHRRVAAGSEIVATRCGPIEYAERGQGPAVLVVHGAGGGFDQGLMFAQPIAERGFRTIAMSRFGYLRTPLPKDASAEAQADAHAFLLDALGIDRAAVIGVSAGGPSAIQFCLRHPDRCTAMVLLVPLAYSDKPPRKLSPVAQFLMERTVSSDFILWSASRLLRTPMVESILGTPIEDVRRLPTAEQGKVYAVLDSILPVSLRTKGLMNEGAIAQALRPLPLERIAAPTLIASVEDDGYKTFAAARYTAEHIPGARFVGYPQGGHLCVGHDKELLSEMVGFLGASSKRAGSALAPPLSPPPGDHGRTASV